MLAPGFVVLKPLLRFPCHIYIYIHTYIPQNPVLFIHAPYVTLRLCEAKPREAPWLHRALGFCASEDPRCWHLKRKVASVTLSNVAELPVEKRRVNLQGDCCLCLDVGGDIGNAL